MAAQNQNLRDELFPNGAPEPEEFIRVIASYIRAQLSEGSENRPFVANSTVPNDAEVH